jgi:tetratricopeptide (TPR) repeat protein
MRGCSAIFVLSAILGAAPTRAQEPLAPQMDVSALRLSVATARRAEIEAAIRASNWGLAERLIIEEIDQQPQSPQLLALVARIFFLDGKPLNTTIALKKAEAIAPLDDDLRFTLALAYIRLGRGEWARTELERLVRSNPNRAEYRYWIGRLDYDGGRYAAAIARFNETLARDPHFMRAYDNLGLCYEALDDVDQAIDHYRAAIRLNRQQSTKSPWPPTNLAILLRQRGELEEAGSLLREALRYDANFANGHYELGVLLNQQGEFDAAVAELNKSATIDARYPEPHYMLARIYRRRGQTGRADEALATFLRLRAARDYGQQR